MTEERYRHSTNLGYYQNSAKMENEFSHKKTMIILVIVVGCFAVLWPKVFYPMLVGSANQHMQPSAIDKTTGCCYVLSETDVETIKIMSELCGNIIKEQAGDVPLTGKQIINICQDEVLKTCGIDISAVLQEQVRLGHSTKQILDEIRSLNGSLCFKYNFGVPTWRLGVPHIITLKNVSDYVRQERPTHVRSEMVHPAFRERGRAIPETGPPSRPPKRIVEGRPGPIPSMRPTMGGAGHVVSPTKQGTGSMGVIMPVYTVGIVIFFTYTLMKIIFKKHPDTDTIYSTVDQDGRYRKDLVGENGSRGSRDSGSCKLVVNAMSALLDEVDQEIEARRLASDVVSQDEHTPNTTLSNGSVKKEEKPSVKVMGMETSESCEGGKKWQSLNSSVLPPAPSVVNEHVPPPQEIYLDRTLPPQSQILVADSATETQKNSGDDAAIVLSGKMTLSVISLENEDIDIDEDDHHIVKREIHESKPIIQEEINNIIKVALDNLEKNIHNDMGVDQVRPKGFPIEESKDKYQQDNGAVDETETEVIKEEEPKYEEQQTDQKHDEFPCENLLIEEAELITEETEKHANEIKNSDDNTQSKDSIEETYKVTVEKQPILQNAIGVEDIKREISFAHAEEEIKPIDKISIENLEHSQIENKIENMNNIKETILQNITSNEESKPDVYFTKVEQEFQSEIKSEEKLRDKIKEENHKAESAKLLMEPSKENKIEESEKNFKSDVMSTKNDLEVQNKTEESDAIRKSNDSICNEKKGNIDLNENLSICKKISDDLNEEFDDISKELEALVENQSADVNKNVSKAAESSDQVPKDIINSDIEEKYEENKSMDNEKDVTEVENNKLLFSDENITMVQTPLVQMSAKSSSEESGSTVMTVSNQGSVVNLNCQQDNKNEQVEEIVVSDEGESDVEYEVETEEEIEISEEEEEEDEGIAGEAQENGNLEVAGANGMLNGGAVLINGTVPHNGTPEEEDSDVEEIEEIIEYSEEEVEESEEEIDDLVHLSSNGNAAGE